MEDGNGDFYSEIRSSIDIITESLEIQWDLYGAQAVCNYYLALYKKKEKDNA